jgi:hypothetical protein
LTDHTFAGFGAIFPVNVALNVTFATAAVPAVVAPPPEKVTVGLPPYPLPPEVRVNVSRVPCPEVFPTAAPLPDVIITVGALE